VRHLEVEYANVRGVAGPDAIERSGGALRMCLLVDLEGWLWVQDRESQH
jgi:hypothetical protein